MSAKAATLRLRRILAALGLAAATLLAASNAGAVDRACAVAETFANPKLLAAMQRGVNLPGWDSEDESRRPTAEQLRAFREKGFTHIRLLLDESRLAPAERVATTDLVQEVAKLAEDAGVSFYFLGASEEVNAKAVEEMQRRYPKLVFAGRRNGYFSRDEEDAVIAGINAARPDILWIGLGVPLEQQFIERNIGRLTGVGVIKTSGGLFDFISGKNARAPAWMQAAGLEWLYRVWLEPRRLAMRYLTTNPQAIGALIRHSA